MTINLNNTAVEAAVPAMSSSLGIPALLGAKIIPFYLIPYGIGALVYAPLTRYISYQWILTAVILLYALFSYFCATAVSLSPLLMGRLGMGVTAAGVIPLGLIVIGQLFEKKVRGRLVGGFFGCSFLASLAGVAVSGVVDWRWLFLIPAVCGLVTAVAILSCRMELLRHVHGASVNYFKSLKEPQIRNIFIFIFVLSFLYHGVHKWFSIYLSRDYGLDKLAISAFFIIIALGGGIGQLLGGYLSDKKGRRTACAVGIILLSVSTMLLAGHYPLIGLAGLLALISMGWTIGHNGFSTVLTDFPDDHRPEIASLNSSIRFTSGGLGFYVSSFFVERNFGWVFFGIGMCLLLTLAALRYVIPNE